MKSAEEVKKTAQIIKDNFKYKESIFRPFIAGTIGSLFYFGEVDKELSKKKFKIYENFIDALDTILANPVHHTEDKLLDLLVSQTKQAYQARSQAIARYPITIEEPTDEDIKIALQNDKRQITGEKIKKARRAIQKGQLKIKQDALHTYKPGTFEKKLLDALIKAELIAKDKNGKLSLPNDMATHQDKINQIYGNLVKIDTKLEANTQWLSYDDENPIDTTTLGLSIGFMGGG